MRVLPSSKARYVGKNKEVRWRGTNRWQCKGNLKWQINKCSVIAYIVQSIQKDSYKKALWTLKPGGLKKDNERKISRGPSGFHMTGYQKILRKVVHGFVTSVI